MKTAKALQRVLFATAISSILFAACKKSSSDSGSTTYTDAQLQTQADDEARVSTETDAAFDDVNTAMGSEASITGSSVNPQVRYGVVTDGGNQDTVKTELSNAVVALDTVDNPHTITITYNGKTSDSLRTRTGSIVISWKAGTWWTTAGDQITVNFNNLKITRLLDNKSIVFNGTHTYTNVTGGSIWGLNANSTSSITHQITSSNMTITFDDGSQRSWGFARQRVFSYNQGLVVTESGFHSDGTNNDISEYGTNRYGNSFTARIPQPLVLAQSCLWQITSGTYMLTNAAGSLTLEFGLNANGAATSCPLPGLYYLQLDWAGKGGKTYTFVLPY